MPLLIIQLALLIAVAFVIGAVLGRLIRGRNKDKADAQRTIIAAAASEPAGEERPEPVAPKSSQEKASLPQESLVAPESFAAKVVDQKTDPVPDAEPVGDWDARSPLLAEAGQQDAHRPVPLDAPRGGKADDLTAINGIGQAIQSLLNNLGIYHYNQIALWSAEEKIWVERNIGFPRRATRENWIGQAVKLTAAQKKTSLKGKAKAQKTPARPRAKSVTKTEN